MVADVIFSLGLGIGKGPERVEVLGRQVGHLRNEIVIFVMGVTKDILKI